MARHHRSRQEPVGRDFGVGCRAGEAKDFRPHEGGSRTCAPSWSSSRSSGGSPRERVGDQLEGAAGVGAPADRGRRSGADAGGHAEVGRARQPQAPRAGCSADRAAGVRRRITKERRVFLTNGGRAALDAWLRHRADEPCPLLLSVTKGGKIEHRRMTDQAVAGRVRHLSKTAGVATFGPHDMRRTFVGDLLDAGADLATVQALAGHASPTTTANTTGAGRGRSRRRPVCCTSRSAGDMGVVEDVSVNGSAAASDRTSRRRPRFHPGLRRQGATCPSARGGSAAPGCPALAPRPSWFRPGSVSAAEGGASPVNPVNAVGNEVSRIAVVRAIRDVAPLRCHAGRVEKRLPHYSLDSIKATFATEASLRMTRTSQDAAFALGDLARTWSS